MTLISHRAAFIFLKTHKTAGTSVEAALEPLCLPPGAPAGAHYREMSITPEGIIGGRGRHAKGAAWRNHMSARAVRRGIGRATWRRYFKFTIIRNPYDRMVSMFFSRRSAEERAVLADSFEQSRAAFQEWLPTSRANSNMNKLFIGAAYQMDHVLFYETLEQDFAELAGHWGLPDQLPRHKSNRRVRAEPWTAFYDDASRAYVAKACAFELAYFGYSFTGGPEPGDGLARTARLVRSAPLGIAAAPYAPQKMSF